MKEIHHFSVSITVKNWQLSARHDQIWKILNRKLNNLICQSGIVSDYRSDSVLQISDQHGRYFLDNLIIVMLECKVTTKNNKP